MASRRTIPRVFRWLRGAAMVVALLAFAVALYGCSDNAFVVNGQTVKGSDYKREVDRRITVVREGNPKELEGERGERLKVEIERQTATDMIRSTLMEQQAKKLGVTVPEEEVTRRVEAQRLKSGPEAFAKELKKQGLTEADYRRQIREEVLVDELGKKITADVTATEDEAESFFLKNKERFSASAMVHAAHMLFDTEGQAKMVLEQINRGDDFAMLASSVSQDQATRGNGGDMGWIEQGTMDPAFEQAAFALQPGQVSEVVKTSAGYELIKVLEKRDAYTPPFEEVRSDVMTALVNQKKEEQFADWLRTVYANAEVGIRNDSETWDPKLGMVVRSR